MSNSFFDPDLDEVRAPDPREVKCPKCYGSGLVEVHGQETDCIECEGWGTILVS